MALIMGTVSPCFAQDSAASGGQGSAASGNQGDTASGGPEISPTGEYKEGLAIGGWMFSPEIFLGAVYNSNTNQLADGAANDGTSLRVSPRIVGLL